MGTNKNGKILKYSIFPLRIMNESFSAITIINTSTNGIALYAHHLSHCKAILHATLYDNK